MVVIFIGQVFGDKAIYGPFISQESAVQWAESKSLVQTSYSIVELNPPD